MSFRELTINLPELKALYSRVGDPKVREILRDFYSRMAKDVLIGFFFDGKDIVVIADRQAEFLLRAMGARPTYTGKAPANAHDALPPILSGHFDRRLKLLEETLLAHGLADADMRTWVAFENTFRDAIVKP